MDKLGKALVVLLTPVIVAAPAAPAQTDRYRMSISIDLETHEVAGEMMLAYRNTHGEPLDAIRLRLDPNLREAESKSSLEMKIGKVTDEEGGELQWQYLPHAYGTLGSEMAQAEVFLPRALNSGEPFTLRVSFTIRGKQIIGKALTVLQDDPFWSFDAWYPKAMSFAADRWTTDDDRPSDYEVEIELPADLTVATSGSIVEERSAEGGSRILSLKATNVRGFTVYGSTFWKRYDREAGGVRISVCLSPVFDQWREPLLAAAADAIAYYTEKYAPYPADHLDIILPGRGGGAFAACNIIGVFLGPDMKESHRWLVAHEVAHQYFGTRVAGRRDEIAWVPIGLGLLMDYRYVRDRIPETTRDAREMIPFYAHVRNELGKDTTLTQPLEPIFLQRDERWRYQWNLSLLHGKAFAVCHMLEDLLGEESLRGVIGRLYRTYCDRMVSGGDLIAACEEALGQPLDWFAADWVQGDATLDYAVARAERAGEVWEVEIRQHGSAAFPVLVEAKTASGARLCRRIDRSKAVNVLRFETSEELASVTVNPEGCYPDLDKSNDRWPEPLEEEQRRRPVRVPFLPID